MVTTGIEAINEKIKKESEFVSALMAEMEKVIVGQRFWWDYWRTATS